MLPGVVENPGAAGDLGKVAVLQAHKQFHQGTPCTVKGLPPSFLCLQQLAPRFQRRVMLLGRSTQHLKTEPGARRIHDVVHVEQLPWRVQGAGVRPSVGVPGISWPFAGRLLLPERHARLEWRKLHEPVRVAACGEGDRLQGALDIKGLQRSLADAERQAALCRKPGKAGVPDKVEQREAAGAPQLPPAHLLGQRWRDVIQEHGHIVLEHSGDLMRDATLETTHGPPKARDGWSATPAKSQPCGVAASTCPAASSGAGDSASGLQISHKPHMGPSQDPSSTSRPGFLRR